MELHPLCTLFPRMSRAEFESLVADIKQHGQREPIVIHDGMILDGGNRYRACLEAGIDPQTMKFGGTDIVAYVLSANLQRRHLGAGQHAAIVASCANWANAQAVGKPKSGNFATLQTIADRAAQSGVSERTQGNADRVAKADPELAKQVGRGEISLPKAVEMVSPPKPHEPDPIPEYTETDALKDQVEELQSALAIASMGESTEEQKQAASELITELRAEIKTLSETLRAVKAVRDHLQSENAQMKRQLAAQRKEIDKLSGRKSQ